MIMLRVKIQNQPLNCTTTFEHFQEMEREELVPSGITFVGILYMLLVIAVRLMRGLNTSKGSMDRGI
jgi:hypothetical protein